MLKTKLRDQILGGYQLYQGLRILNDPYDLDRVLSLSSSLLRNAKTEDARMAMEGVRWSPEGVSAVEERYRLKLPETSELLSLPDGTFGRAFGEFLVAHDIDPRAITPPEVVDDLTYLAAHLSETHDIWHVVTGFPPTIEGEVGLAAFGAAQTNSPFQVAIVVGALVKGLKDKSWEMGKYLDAACRGWELGKSAQPLVGVRWDRLWETALEDVRSMLRLSSTGDNL